MFKHKIGDLVKESGELLLILNDTEHKYYYLVFNVKNHKIYYRLKEYLDRYNEYV